MSSHIIFLLVHWTFALLIHVAILRYFGHAADSLMNELDRIEVCVPHGDVFSVLLRRAVVEHVSLL